MEMKESTRSGDDVKASLHTEALKLADEWLDDELHDWRDSEQDWAWKAYHMIRRLVEELDCALDYIKQYQLEKQGEPVAWMDKYGNVCTDIQKKMYQGNITAQYNYDKNTIPLYTTPQIEFEWKKHLDKVIIDQQKEIKKLRTTPQTKPLSDDEIWELHQEHIDEIPCGHSMKTVGFVEFARAIEERHGIK